MKAIALLCSSLLFAASLRADMVIVQKVEGAGQFSEMTVKLKNGKALMEVAPQISTIYDSGSGDVITIMHAQKMYVKLPAATAKALAEHLQKLPANPAEATPPPSGASKLQPTGKTETVNNYPTELFTCDLGGMHVTYWIAKNFPHYDQILAQMLPLQQNGVVAALTKGLAPGPKDFPGMPIKTEVDTQGQKFTVTLISVKDQPLSDSDFQIPAGYKEMNMPTLPGFGG